MKKKVLKVFGIVAAVATIGFSMAGCGEPIAMPPSHGGGSVTVEDVIGNWQGNMQGMPFTVSITASNWTFTSAAFNDIGTFIQDGPYSARLFSTNLWGAEVGRVELININTIRLTQNQLADFPGTYILTRM